MNRINGGHSPKLSSAGTYTLDGNQAVAYSRIRYTLAVTCQSRKTTRSPPEDF